VAFLSEGQTLKEVAYQMGISSATVAGDLERARAKTGTKTRLELVSAYRAKHGAGER
jgi:DNA-binding CsgD family transcriptional regulator